MKPKQAALILSGRLHDAINQVLEIIRTHAPDNDTDTFVVDAVHGIVEITVYGAVPNGRRLKRDVCALPFVATYQTCQGFEVERVIKVAV